MPRSLVLLALAALVSTSPARAQRPTDDDARWQESCRDGWNGDDERGRHCEIRNFTITDAGRSLQIDGRQNGSIRVMGWNGSTVQVTARLQANAGSEAEAENLLKEVRVSVSGGVRTEFPITMQGRIGRQLSLALGGGGAPIRAMTTNGSVTLSHR